MSDRILIRRTTWDDIWVAHSGCVVDVQNAILARYHYTVLDGPKIPNTSLDRVIRNILKNETNQTL